MGSRVIRSLGDLVEVPQAELADCLAALRRAIESHKQLRAAARPTETIPAFTQFEWQPRERRAPLALQVTSTTPVEDLGLKPSAVYRFREMNLYALEDFAEVSEIDLRRVRDVGEATVAHLREQLAAAGLRFKEPENLHHRFAQRVKLAREMPPEERKKAISDDSAVADLGLKTTTLTRCIGKGILTVGQLRAMTLRELYLPFGQSSMTDLLECLDAVGLELLSRPTQIERWRYHAIRREALKRPDGSAPVEDLEPWIGGVVRDLARGGIGTVADLARIAAAGGRRTRGVGEFAWSKIFDYFSVPRRDVSGK